MKQKIIFIFALLSFFLPQKASAFCTSSNTDVYLTTNPGNVTYVTTKSREEFMGLASRTPSPNTVGLTLARFNLRVTPQAKVEREGSKMCVSLKSLDVKMGYDELTVYIDKKYKSSSCEYKVTKNHEKYHVAVYQQAMLFFRPDIEKQIKKSLKQLKPQIVRTMQERDQVLMEQYQKVMDDLTPLIDHINKVTAEKNYQIDTPESYKETTALCDNW